MATSSPPSPLSGGPLLLVTATPVETGALHSKLLPRDGHASIVREPKDAYTYYLAKLGEADVVHVQCGMGSATHGGSILTVNHAIRAWKPCGIVMVGIAFGVDESKQRIADVLVSRQIIPYEHQRIGELENEIRGLNALAGPILRNHFVNATTWSHEVEGELCRILDGDILSGEKLIDKRKYRDQLVSEYGPVTGGEMEGFGLVAAARDGKIQEWIVIKGICDFADGNKKKDKKKRQIAAAAAAVSLCEHVLKDLRCAHPPFESPPATEMHVQAADGALARDILFSSYRASVERYYLERQFDLRVLELIRAGNIWIHGKSGVGKTVFLQRAASRLGFQCLYLDLSSSVNAPPASLFEDAYWQIASYYGEDGELNNKDRHADCGYWVRLIFALLSQRIRGDTLIVVDEFSLKSPADLEDFINHALSLILKLTNSSLAHHLHLAFASIRRPVNVGDSIFAKINERIPLVEMDEWEVNEVGLLAKKIQHELSNEISLVGLEEVEVKTPRALKTLIRLHLMDMVSDPTISLIQSARNHYDELR